MRHLSLTFSIALAVWAVGCEKKKSSAAPAAEVATSAAAPAPSDTILLGEVGSLTGSEAAFGISTRDGIDMALRELNAAGGVRGKKLAVRVYDNQSKPEESASAITRLIDQDKVVLVLGEVASSNSLAMAPKAQAAKVPMLSPSSTNPKVTEVGDYIFRVCFIDPFQGYVMAKFAAENLKLKNVAILKDVKSAYSMGLTDVFEKKFVELGGSIVEVQAYSKGDTDFRAQLTALKKSKPEGLYIPGYYNDVGLIARQARELGLKVTMLGADGWDSAKLFELGGSAVDGAYISNHYSADDPSERVQKFIRNYKAAYGSIPDSLAAMGYDAAYIAAEALKQAKDLTGPSVRDALANLKDFPGVTGTISIDANRNAVKPAVVLQVASGAFKHVTTISP